VNAGRREFFGFFALSAMLHTAALTAVLRPDAIEPLVRNDTILFRFDRLAPVPAAPSENAAAPRPAPASSTSAPAEPKPVLRDRQAAVAFEQPTVEPVAEPKQDSVRPDAVAKQAESVLEEKKLDALQEQRVASVPRDSSSAAERSAVDAAAADARLERVRATYEQELSAWLDRHKYYPAPLRRRRLEGEGEMRIRIGRNGTVLYAGMNRSLPHSMLDEVALDWAERANPFPDVPETIPGEAYEFLVPVEFTIR
jgi:protein TonB